MGNLTWLSRKESPKVIMLGSSETGKTTIFRHLTKKSEFLIPVIGFTIEYAECEKVKLMKWDLRHRSDSSTFAFFYRKYYEQTQVIIYVLDSSSTFTNLNEALIEFNHVLNEQTLSNVPLLVLVNKITPCDMTLSDLSALMKLSSLKRKWQIRLVNALTGAGIAAAFQWVRSALPKDGTQ